MSFQPRNDLGFIDLFAGCGGISLGLCQAGWTGMFAVEKDSLAFSTFERNFLNAGSRCNFQWPAWFPRKATNIDAALVGHRRQLLRLRGTVDLVAGGPPCQGFSFAGLRRRADPRNLLLDKYAEFVDLVQPDALVLENVPGIQVPHGPTESGHRQRTNGTPRQSYLDLLLEKLGNMRYSVATRLLDAAEFGVPQKRPRLIVVGLKRSLADDLPGGADHVFALIERCRHKQLKRLDLFPPISAEEAIGDLVVRGPSSLKNCSDSQRQGFSEIRYRGPITPFQRLMHDGLLTEPMNSMRIARHSQAVRERFATILEHCRRGTRIGDDWRNLLGLRKHRTHPMAAGEPAPTLTTLPDDIIHYRDPRILTVRECARLQSFPDWFQFCGKYTTGGQLRTKECPRYSQVGNAVPPLLAAAIGGGIAMALIEARLTQSKSTLRRETPGGLLVGRG